MHFDQTSLAREQARVAKQVLAPKRLDDRRVLVVGGAGYVGSVLCDHLLAQGYKVRSFDNLTYGHGQTVVPFLGQADYEFVYGDLTRGDALDAALDGVTDVVLLAGLVGDPVTKKYPGLAAAVNDDGHDLLIGKLEGCGLNKVVFVSTCSNYGLIEGDQLADEEFELKPLSLYAKSKVRVETRLLALKGAVDYSTTILRFATAFGLSPRMRFDLTVSEFTRAMFMGEDLLVYDAHTWRPYSHLRDFATLIGTVLVAPVETVGYEVFNAGGEVNNFTKQMIVDAILKVLPRAKVRYQQHGADPRNYKVDFTKVRSKLGFQPAYTVDDGICELVSALGNGLFRNIDQPPNFHGNWELPGA